MLFGCSEIFSRSRRHYFLSVFVVAGLTLSLLSFLFGFNFWCTSLIFVEKMGGRAGGSCRTGKGVKEKLGHLSTRQESGLRTLMIKVLQ